MFFNRFFFLLLSIIIVPIYSMEYSELINVNKHESIHLFELPNELLVSMAECYVENNIDTAAQLDAEVKRYMYAARALLPVIKTCKKLRDIGKSALRKYHTEAQSLIDQRGGAYSIANQSISPYSIDYKLLQMLCTQFNLDINKQKFNVKLNNIQDGDPEYNFDNNDGETMLTCYLKNRLPARFIEKLLPLGANPNIPNSKKEEPIDVAFDYSSDAFLLLAENGAKLNNKYTIEEYNDGKWIIRKMPTGWIQKYYIPNKNLS